VAGRIDHLAFDPVHQRLFVAALGNNTVEVIDTAKGAHLRSLGGFHEPQGIAIASDFEAVAVANGDTGTLQLLDVNTLQTRWTVSIGGDADNVRYDAKSRRLLVAAEGGLSAVDPASGRVLERVAIAGHPESFQLEAQGTRVYANLPGASEIVVADRQGMTVRARWPTGSCQSNYPMALDEATRRLFAGCRRPASVLIVDTATGKAVANVPTVRDTDDMFYDSDNRTLYVIGGQGAVDVMTRDGDRLVVREQVPTRNGARTGLLVAADRRLYVAAPARDGKAAEILVFETR